MKIITSVVNNPAFIELQYKSFAKYVTCDYEFMVFNDAKPFPDDTNGGDSGIRQAIIDTCDKLNIKYVNIDNFRHQYMKDAAIRCADSCNVMLEFQKKNTDDYLLIDSDMFLVDYFDPQKDFNDCASAVVLQKRENLEYIWNGLGYFNMSRIGDTKTKMNWELISGLTDVGGKMHEWLTINKSTPGFFHHIDHKPSLTWSMSDIPDILKSNLKLMDFLETDPRNKDGKFFSEIYANKFLHYRAGGNWRGEGMKFHFQLTEKLKSTFEI